MYDIPKAQYKGKLVQYTYYPFSRSNIEDQKEQFGGLDRLFEKVKLLSDVELGVFHNIYEI